MSSHNNNYIDLISTSHKNILGILRQYFSPSIVPIYYPVSLKKIYVNPGVGIAKASVKCINIAHEIGNRLVNKYFEISFSDLLIVKRSDFVYLKDMIKRLIREKFLLTRS